MEPECVADTRDYIKRGGAVGASDPKLVRTSYWPSGELSNSKRRK